MDVLFILHADHEQNCGTTAMRVVSSSDADPYSSAAAAAAALYGPLHGGANEAVVRMLTEIGSIDNVPAFVEDVKEGKGRLMGFGHRVYKNYDPRARIIKQTAYDVFEVTGKNPLLDIALKLEETALSDPYFVDRKLYPNVDFYSGLIYQAMGFPVEMFTVLFAIPRMSGWLAHWDRAARRQGPEDLPAPPVVHRRGRARLHQARRPLSSKGGRRPSPLWNPPSWASKAGGAVLRACSLPPSRASISRRNLGLATAHVGSAPRRRRAGSAISSCGPGGAGRGRRGSPRW